MPKNSLSSYEKDLLEKDIREFEYAALFSKEGNFIERFQGGIGFAIINPSVIEEGMILTHNHITGNSFSIADLAVGKKYLLSEIRVVTEKGVYSMKNENNQWPSEEELNQCSNDIKNHKGFLSSVLNLLFTELYIGIDPQTAHNMIECDLVCKGIAKIFHLTYAFYPRK